MHSKRLMIYNSRRQMLVELSKKKELEKINKIALNSLKELRGMFQNYSHDQLDPKTVELLGDDPLLKGKKLLKLISKSEKGYLEKEGREKLIQIHCNNQIFPQIIHYLKFDNNEFQICYNVDLLDKIADYNLTKIAFNETYRKLQNVSDQTLILIHLICIQHQIKKQENFSILYNTEQDYQVIRQLHEDTQKMIQDKEKNNEQQIEAILTQLYEQSLVEREKQKPMFKKSLYLVFNVLLSILMDERVASPDYLRLLKLKKITSKQDDDNQIQQYMVVFKPTIKIVNQMISIEKIQSYVENLQLDQDPFNQKLPIYDKFYSLVGQFYSKFLMINSDDIIVNYLRYLETYFRLHQVSLYKIYFEDDKFKQIVEVINLTHGHQIKEIFKQNSFENDAQYLECSTNLLKIGTYLFKLGKVITINPSSQQEKKQSSLSLIFHQFIEQEVARCRTFPIFLMYIKCIDNQYYFNDTLLDTKELFDNSRFSRFVSLRKLEKVKPNRLSENDVIVAQIKILYDQREQIKNELNLQLSGNIHCQNLLESLDSQNPEVKKVLINLLAYALHKIDISV